MGSSCNCAFSDLFHRERTELHDGDSREHTREAVVGRSHKSDSDSDENDIFGDSDSDENDIFADPEKKEKKQGKEKKHKSEQKEEKKQSEEEEEEEEEDDGLTEEERKKKALQGAIAKALMRNAQGELPDALGDKRKERKKKEEEERAKQEEEQSDDSDWKVRGTHSDVRLLE